MSHLIDANRAALVLVDYQQRLMPAIDRHDAVIANALLLADIARALTLPVIGTEQNPAGLGPNVAAIRERCDATLAKMHFDGCADGLVALLHEQVGGPPRELVIAGCEAHVCLLQTTMGLLDAGLAVSVVADACGSRTAANHALAMRRLERAGARIVSVEMVAFEWLRTCRHDRFKTVLTLLKNAKPG
jgi:nicotinamidase-related amidase